VSPAKARPATRFFIGRTEVVPGGHSELSEVWTDLEGNWILGSSRYICLLADPADQWAVLVDPETVARSTSVLPLER